MFNICISKWSFLCYKKIKNYMYFNLLYFFMLLLMCCLFRKVKQDNDIDFIRDQDKIMVVKLKVEVDNIIYNIVKLFIVFIGI